ncbi:hypothetical protein AK88_03619 [Plasmodium fragile]|uniref:Plasmodium RESA N-terminal domain-containing protein n=1 Tax=Plasmodium fragile TaxID=5857 RepID=A0A0D9QIU0_PLAFR|nr:uncharacterized protein AK88_03619 [Plasmodium fragile]KJP86707.1 hypothetical protein AK88_03619 [Plasmodium fragile]
MVHSNNTQTSTRGLSQGASQCRHGKAYSAGNEEGKTHDKKAHMSFFSKTAAMLFVVACIFLTHQDDYETQEEHVTKLRVHNRVARTLAKGSAAPSEHELELDPMEFEHYDDAPPTYEQSYEGAYDDVEQPYEQTYELTPKRIYCRNQWTKPKTRCYSERPGAILKEWKMVEYQVPQEVHYDGEWKREHDAREEEVHESIQSFDLPQEPIVQVKEEDAKAKTQFLRAETNVPSGEPTQQSDEQVGVKAHNDPADYMSTLLEPYEGINYYDKEEQDNEKKRKEATHTIEKYEGKVAEDSENYRIHSSIAFHYEMTCFDERLTDSEINEKLEQIEEEPHKWELLSLYWQSYRNERSKYIALKKSLKKKILELRNKQTVVSLKIYNKKWKKCEEIINNNLTEQNEHVNEVFRTMVAKEKLSTYEFEKILYDFRESWKEMALKTADECIAIIEKPIALEVIYVADRFDEIGMRVPGFTVQGLGFQGSGFCA